MSIIIYDTNYSENTSKINLSGIALLGTYLFSKLSEVVLNIIIIIEIDK